MPRDPECPFCDGHDTEIMNACGSHASVSAYWCRPCGSPFEIMKWRG
ncbi:MAG: PaaD-like zinc ribbon domain-containing protein [Longimicrobiales bacterium]